MNNKQTSFYVNAAFIALTCFLTCFVFGSDSPADSLSTNRFNTPEAHQHVQYLDKFSHHPHAHSPQPPPSQPHHHPSAQGHSPSVYHPPAPVGSGHMEKRNSYNLLSEAMSQAVSNEFHSLGSGSADGACQADDLECYTNNVQDRLGMEAIRTLHRQLDDDDNGNIDLSESDDFLREELKYDSGYEKRQKAFHFNDDMHISVKELWEAWLRSEVHNWTIEQTTDWLAQSVQLPQYVELFKLHQVTGAALPRLAVNNMHYVGNVLGIKDPIHKQKIALKAMDVVLFGPPRETGTRWKDYILVTLLLSAIIGCWYAYQQNKNAKRHLRRMAQDMEGLQRAETSLQEMQKELERARMEQESAETEKLDLERRLKEAPLLSSSSSDLEVQQLKKEIEMLRNELSRAEIELVDNCWTPPPQLQSWLQYTYELESKNHLKKRISAEKQLQSAREACEKLRKKRSSLVGAFVSTHGKSIDDVDRSIVEARNSLGEVTNELQERLHRWKQIESCLGFNIVNNNGLQYLDGILYGRNGNLSGTASSKGSRGRITSSTDDLDDESVQGMFDSYSRSSLHMNSGSVSSANAANANYRDRERDRDREDSSSEEGVGIDNTQAVQFYLGNVPPPSQQQLPTTIVSPPPERPPRAAHMAATTTSTAECANSTAGNHVGNASGNNVCAPSPTTTTTTTISPIHHNNAPFSNYAFNDSQQNVTTAMLDNHNRHSPSASSDCSSLVSSRVKKQNITLDTISTQSVPIGRAPMPPPRRAYQSQMLRSQSTDLVPMDIHTHTAYYPRQSTATMQQQQQQQQQQQLQQHQQQQQLQQQLYGISTVTTAGGNTGKKMVKQHSTASQQSTSSTSSSVQSAPPNVAANNISNITSTSDNGTVGQFSNRWSSPERFIHTNNNNNIINKGPTTIQSRTTDRDRADPVPSIQQQQQQSKQSAKVPNITDTANITNTFPQSMSAPFGLQSNRSNATTSSESSNIASASHGNTELEKNKQTSDTISLSDTVSLDGSTKKRRRRIRFPFGGSKKSTTTTAQSKDNNHDNGNTNSNTTKSKFT